MFDVILFIIYFLLFYLNDIQVYHNNIKNDITFEYFEKYIQHHFSLHFVGFFCVRLKKKTDNLYFWHFFLHIPIVDMCGSIDNSLDILNYDNQCSSSFYGSFNTFMCWMRLNSNIIIEQFHCQKDNTHLNNYHVLSRFFFDSLKLNELVQ